MQMKFHLCPGKLCKITTANDTVQILLLACWSFVSGFEIALSAFVNMQCYITVHIHTLHFAD